MFQHLWLLVPHGWETAAFALPRAVSVDKNFLIMHEYHQATELNSVIND